MDAGDVGPKKAAVPSGVSDKPVYRRAISFDVAEIGIAARLKPIAYLLPDPPGQATGDVFGSSKKGTARSEDGNKGSVPLRLRTNPGLWREPTRRVSCRKRKEMR